MSSWSSGIMSVFDDFDVELATGLTGRADVAAQVIPRLAAWHGRLHILNSESSAESTGHGSPLPSLKHGGPGRAGGGEELGGMRAVKHLMQRAAVQGSPHMLNAVVCETSPSA
jgi:oxepin-CoA hydrolase/3-oxo-5,6-dehydrosuberyl-CoA semialdehyde dehydrogenase